MQAATIEVQNPDAKRKPFATHYRGVTTYTEPKEFRIRLPQNLRDDPLGQMHSRGQLGPHGKADLLLDAGRRLQEEHEAAGTRLRSPGDIAERVDGGQIAVAGPSPRQMMAGRTIAVWRTFVVSEHGNAGWRILEAVCIDKLNLRQCALRWHGEASRANEAYVGRLLREGLESLGKAQSRRG